MVRPCFCHSGFKGMLAEPQTSSFSFCSKMTPNYSFHGRPFFLSLTLAVSKSIFSPSNGAPVNDSCPAFRA